MSDQDSSAADRGSGLSDQLGPIEALRFFCSKNMSAQAWLDVESLFDAVIADRATAVAAERERCARAARDAIHSVPAEMRFSADIMIHATDAAIGWPNAELTGASAHAERSNDAERAPR